MMTKTTLRTFFLLVNPEPWTSPSASLGRKGGKPIPQLHKNPRLRSYQEEVKEALAELALPAPFEEDVELEFYFWRYLERYEINGKSRRRNVADATNLQKALEDALQGLLFENDRQVKRITSHIVEQGPDTEFGVLVRVRQGMLPLAHPSVLKTKEIHLKACISNGEGATYCEESVVEW